MPEVDLKIGGRSYLVACQDGEELHLKSAAGLLNAEAEHVVKSSGGRLPESRVLLMAGLMLADRMAEAQETVQAEPEADVSKLAELEAQLAELHVANTALKSRAEGAEKALAASETTPAAPQNGGLAEELLEKVARELEAVADQAEGKAHA